MPTAVRPMGADAQNKRQSCAPPAEPTKTAGIRTMRVAMAKNPWYTSKMVSQGRAFMQSKIVAIVMTFALVCALFIPDLWTLIGVDSNVESDIILFIVFLLFSFEFIGLCLTDPMYLFTFFFFMDIIGTFSMIWDISFFFGADAKEPKIVNNDNSGGTPANLMVLRAARAAKLAARAGRISRLLRFLRFLPFLGGGGKQDPDAGIARSISNQLSNLLATRVAFLTILLVMIVPVIEMLQFPRNDQSLMTWTERLSITYGETAQDCSPSSASPCIPTDVAKQNLNQELTQMRDFYDNKLFGPFRACHGQEITDGFACAEDISSWGPTFSSPSRGSEVWIVHTKTFSVFFNMYGAHKMEAVMNMLLIITVIFIMCFSGLALSSVVSELAVRPLERMLGTVRQIAKTVFKFSEEVHEEDDQEKLDIDRASEMKLLERVVNKLAVIVDLTTQTEQAVEQTEDMDEEDIGVLTMMRGGDNIGKDPSKTPNAHSIVRASRSTPASRPTATPCGAQAVPTLRQVSEANIEDFGMSMEIFDSWYFNPLEMKKEQLIGLACFCVTKFQSDFNYTIIGEEEETVLHTFMSAVEREYLANPYHNFAHAMDVLHTCQRCMRLSQSELWLSELDQTAVLIAAICHDLGHPGVNNGFLVEVQHELALRYNDRSPLENMHCAKMWQILSVESTNIFSKLPADEYRQIRKISIRMILHTDNAKHMEMIKTLQMLLEVNSEVFSGSGHDGDPSASPSTLECELFQGEEVKATLLDLFLHSADVSNSCKAWKVCELWADVVLEEFFAQGDQEKALGIPVQMLNDREKVVRPFSQICFLDFMVAPLVALEVRILPGLHDMGENLVDNLGHWEDVRIKLLNPSDEDKSKMQARISAQRDKMNAAKTREPPP